MNRVSIPGFMKQAPLTRFIHNSQRVNEDIEFEDASPQLFLLSFEPGEIRPIHKHDEVRVTLVRSGKALFTLGNEEISAVQGDILITMPLEEHSLEVIGSEPLLLAELVLVIEPN